MNNKQIRLTELLNSTDGRSLVLDTSRGLVMGGLPGLEHYEDAIHPLLPLLDGIVTSPGQVRRVPARTRHDAALLIQSDWINALRGHDFVLPPEKIEYIPLLEIQDAVELGANALVMHFVLGYEEEIETICIKRLVNLALAGIELGMPLIVNVQPLGPRVVLMNKAIELGVSYAIEGGADGVVVPWPGQESFSIISKMAGGSPVWVKPGNLDIDGPVIKEALAAGVAGLWLDEGIFATDNPSDLLKAFHASVHVQADV